jgi:hypothetical protein
MLIQFVFLYVKIGLIECVEEGLGLLLRREHSPNIGVTT